MWASFRLCLVLGYSLFCMLGGVVAYCVSMPCEESLHRRAYLRKNRVMAYLLKHGLGELSCCERVALLCLTSRC